ncbi:ABC transporter permease [Halobacteriales archaeon QS_4_62_28]|nr:MAG: ABC transporter permease [Halobacteriales archaeon QS_4_62_28]
MLGTVLDLAYPSRITNRLLAENSQTKRALARLRQNTIGMVGLGILVGYLAVAVVGPLYVTSDPNAIQAADRLQAPSLAHPFGTDRFGRDVFARTIVAARANLRVAAIVVASSSLAGVTLGLLAGYYQGLVDEAIMRVVDVLFAFPHLLLGLIVIAILGPGLDKAIVALSVAYVPVMIRITRGSAISVRNEEYVLAAESYGESSMNIMFRDMLPNLLSAVLVQATIIFAFSTLTEAGLSYLGLSAQPPTITWGVMISEAQATLELAPWASFFPGVAIMITVLGLTFFGVGLRDAFDPKTKIDIEEGR